MSRSESFRVGSSPDPFVQHMSEKFTKDAGLPAPKRDFGDVVMTTRASRTIGRAYDALPLDHPGAHPAFKALIEETGRQFDFMTKPRSKGGMGIDVQVTKEDPYGFGGEKPKADYSNWSADKVVPEFTNDVREHNRMKVYSTATTGGHPFMTDDQNDMFRAVHDVFGHMGSGRGIDMHGEEAAYQKHASMFSAHARGALASETRGQNQSLHLNGQFGPQRVAFLPARLQTAQFARVGSAVEHARAVIDARRENAKQGIAVAE